MIKWLKTKFCRWVYRVPARHEIERSLAFNTGTQRLAIGRQYVYGLKLVELAYNFGTSQAEIKRILWDVYEKAQRARAHRDAQRKSSLPPPRY